MKLYYFPMELLGALAVFCVGLEKRKGFWIRLGLILAVFGMIFLTNPVTKIIQVFYPELGVSLDQVLEIPELGVELYHAADNSGTGASPDQTVGTPEISQGTARIAGFLVYTIFFVLNFFLMVFAVVGILFRLTIKEMFYCGTCAYICEHMAYCVRILVSAMYDGWVTSQSYGSSGIASPGKPLYFLIHVSVYVICYYVFSSKMIRNHHYTTTAVQSLGLMIISAFLVVGMSMVASLMSFEPIHAIYALFACGFVLYSQLKQQKEMTLQKELLLQQQMWRKHKSQYEISRDTIEIINTKCHDLKHQVDALRAIGTIEEQKKVLDSIEDSVMIYDTITKTGNEILDTLLTEKGLLCQQRKITLSSIVDGQSLEFMDPVDLYTLFGNAIDNAMEAVRDLPEELRGITLHVAKKAGMLLIQVENPYFGEITIRDGIPVTSKMDKAYHGFGIRSMRQIAEKYHGYLKIEAKNKVFLLRITIPRASV